MPVPVPPSALGCSTGELNAPVSLVTVCASESRFAQWTVVPGLTVTTCGPKAKSRMVMAFAAAGFAAEAVAGAVEGIPDMLGMAVASGDGVPDVPA